MRVPPRTNWHTSDLTKVRPADVRKQVIVCAKMSRMTSRSSTRKPDEFPVMSRANSGAHTPAKEPRFPQLSSAFEAGDCSHFSPSLQTFQQSLQRHGLSGNCDFLQGQLGGRQIEIVTTLTRPVSPSNIHRNWKANQYGICGQLCRQNGIFQVAQKLLPTRANWTRQLQLMSRPTAPSWQVRSARDGTPHTTTI